MFKLMDVRKYSQINAKNFCLSGPNYTLSINYYTSGTKYIGVIYTAHQKFSTEFNTMSYFE